MKTELWDTDMPFSTLKAIASTVFHYWTALLAPILVLPLILQAAGFLDDSDLFLSEPTIRATPMASSHSSYRTSSATSSSARFSQSSRNSGRSSRSNLSWVASEIHEHGSATGSCYLQDVGTWLEGTSGLSLHSGHIGELRTLCRRHEEQNH